MDFKVGDLVLFREDTQWELAVVKISSLDTELVVMPNQWFRYEKPWFLYVSALARQNKIINLQHCATEQRQAICSLLSADTSLL